MFRHIFFYFFFIFRPIHIFIFWLVFLLLLLSNVDQLSVCRIPFDFTTSHIQMSNRMKGKTGEQKTEKLFTVKWTTITCHGTFANEHCSVCCSLFTQLEFNISDKYVAVDCCCCFDYCYLCFDLVWFVSFTILGTNLRHNSATRFVIWSNFFLCRYNSPFVLSN